MQHISGISREQISFTSLEDFIVQDHEVRFIDAFVNEIDLLKLGFQVQTLKKEGRPSFQTSVYLKLYLYAYLNGIRSSRKLEKECHRNIEVQWLLHGMTPNYHSISDFRKDNPKALRQLFKLFVSFLKDAELIAGEIIAIDGTKVRANNSKKANYSQKKIDRHIDYINNKVEEYLKELDEVDEADNQLKVRNVEAKIAKLKERKIDYELLEMKLQASGDTQISTTDEDARALLVQGVVVEICHNMQAAVDAKHNLVVATHTINRNDRNAMTDIALEAKENLCVEGFTALLDKGYHNGRQIKQCTDDSITTIVAQQEIVNSNTKGTTPDYLVTKFIYNKEADTYTCPQGETLVSTGTWHTKKSEDKIHYRFKTYRTPKCRDCPVQNLCTAKEDRRREIQRSEFADAVEANNKRYLENSELYRKRQEINEHIFGTIKRQWGFNHTNLRGLEKVNGEHSLIMLVYNIKRTINILGIPDLIEKLKNWKSPYKRNDFVLFLRACFKPKYEHFIFQQKLAA
jgi:transposase